MIRIAVFIISGLWAGSAVAQGTNWRFHERIDPINDRTGGALEVTARDGKSKLIFSCDLGQKDRPITIQYAAKRYLGSKFGRVIVRIDGAEPISGIWNFNSTVAFTFEAKDVRQTARPLQTAGHVVVRAIDFENQPVDAVFDFTWARSKVQSVVEACGSPGFFED